MKKNILAILIALACSLTACFYEETFDTVPEAESLAKVSINRNIVYFDDIYKPAYLSKAYIKIILLDIVSKHQK